MNSYQLVLSFHVVIAILGLGQLAGLAVVGASQDGVSVAPATWTAFRRLTLGARWSLPLLFLSGALIEFLTGRGFHDRWWFRLSVSRRTVEDLWGFCRTCSFAAECRGGCSFTAHALLGRPGNNPYCFFRARTLAKRGQRERLVPVERAPGVPFDNGRFEILLEEMTAPVPHVESPARLLRIWPGQ